MQINNWKVDESQFDLKIMNKSNLLFLIESDDGIKFGGFISSKIEKIWKYPDYKSISDNKAFIFTFKYNKPMKFDIKKDWKKDKAFFLCDKSYDVLFSSIILDKFVKYNYFFLNLPINNPLHFPLE